MYPVNPAQYRAPYALILARSLSGIPLEKIEKQKVPEKIIEGSLEERVDDFSPIQAIAVTENVQAYNEQKYHFSHPPVTEMERALQAYEHHQKETQKRYIDITT